MSISAQELLWYLYLGIPALFILGGAALLSSRLRN